jgi:SOS-response transcriptional repressor LexA
MQLIVEYVVIIGDLWTKCYCTIKWWCAIFPGVTKNQTKLLEFIAAYRRENGTSPTLREMAEGTGVYDNKSVLWMITALEKRGLLERSRARSSRSVRLTEQGWNALGASGKPRDLREELLGGTQLRHTIQRFDFNTVSVLSPSNDLQWMEQDGPKIRTNGTS